jgi:hypothetical protein
VDQLLKDVTNMVTIKIPRGVDQPFPVEWTKEGSSPATWVSLVEKKCPQLFQLQQDYLSNTNLINQFRLQQICSEELQPLSFPESLFSRIADKFKFTQTSKITLANIITFLLISSASQPLEDSQYANCQ